MGGAIASGIVAVFAMVLTDEVFFAATFLTAVFFGAVFFEATLAVFFTAVFFVARLAAGAGLSVVSTGDWAAGS